MNKNGTAGLFDLPAVDAWPNCSTPDCGNKVCVWATAKLCAPCSVQLLGDDEMIRRWNETHDDAWDKPWPPGRPPRHA